MKRRTVVYTTFWTKRGMVEGPSFRSVVEAERACLKALAEGSVKVRYWIFDSHRGEIRKIYTKKKPFWHDE